MSEWTHKTIQKKKERKNRMVKTEGKITDLESVKRYLEKEEASNSKQDDEFPKEFIEPLVFHDLRLDLIQPGRVVFSMKIPPRLLVRILLLSSINFVFI